MAKYYCSNCRESLPEDRQKLLKIGENRNVVFCDGCNCYVTLEDKTANKPK